MYTEQTAGLLNTDVIFNSHHIHPIYKSRLSTSRTRFINSASSTSRSIFGANLASVISALNNMTSTINTQSSNTQSSNTQHNTPSVANMLNQLTAQSVTPNVYTYNFTGLFDNIGNIVALYPVTASFLTDLGNENMQSIFTRFISELINTGTYEDVRVPLSENVFEQLGSSNYKNIKDNFDKSGIRCDTACVICQEDFKDEDGVTNVKCTNNHIFHTDCVKPWLTQMSKKCPTCREDLTESSVASIVDNGGADATSQ